MGHNTTLFFAHGHSNPELLQTVYKGHRRGRQKPVCLGAKIERPWRNFAQLIISNEIKTTKSLPLRVENNAAFPWTLAQTRQ